MIKIANGQIIDEHTDEAKRASQLAIAREDEWVTQSLHPTICVGEPSGKRREE